MTRTLVILAVGVALGYTIGFRDARQHDQTIAERLLDRAGGAVRGKYSSNVDAQGDSTATR